MTEKKKGAERLTHPFAPFCPEEARVLILGSFPSVRSRKTGFFYGHPQNRFWRVAAALASDDIPRNVAEKQAFLTRHGIALFDVIASCLITGSADGSIREAEPADLTPLFTRGVQAVFTNGKKADALYRKYQLPRTGVAATYLPSTSPANAVCSFEALLSAWAPVKEFLR